MSSKIILMVITKLMSKRKADSIELTDAVDVSAAVDAVQSLEDFVPHRARDAPEIWKVIPGFPKYEVSSEGNLQVITTGKTRKSYVNKGGYKMLSLQLNGKLKGKLIGSLVLTAFVGASTGDQTVDHVNRNRVDDNLANLRWATKAEQSANRNKPSTIPATKKPVIVTSSDGNKSEFPSRTEAAEFLGTSAWCVSNAIWNNESCNDHHVQYGNVSSFEPNGQIVDIPGLAGYKASSDGAIQMINGRWTKGFLVANYLTVKILGSPRGVHVLVIKAFTGERPEGYVIDHVDGNPHNNSAANLEYVTRSENAKRAVKTGLIDTSVSMKAVDQFGKDGVFIKRHASIRGAAMELGLNQSAISHCCTKRSKFSGGFVWKYASAAS
jgi:hypothetical protein